MSFHAGQFRSLIERVLTEFDPKLASEAAVNLLLGTAAQESRFGTYLRQLGGGPALGAFQMEPATYDDLRERYRKHYPVLMINGGAASLEWNLKIAIVMARMKYRDDPHALPAADDLPGLAATWKRVYNTPLGKGTEAEFIENYQKFVGA